MTLSGSNFRSPLPPHGSLSTEFAFAATTNRNNQLPPLTRRANPKCCQFLQFIKCLQAIQGVVKKHCQIVNMRNNWNIVAFSHLQILP